MNKNMKTLSLPIVDMLLMKSTMPSGRKAGQNLSGGTKTMQKKLV